MFRLNKILCHCLSTTFASRGFQIKKIQRPLQSLALIFLLAGQPTFGKQIALSFDDAPVGTTLHFESSKRTKELIKKLKELNVSGAMIFANPCKNKSKSIAQLKHYVDAGHLIANHTCNHPRFDDVGFVEFSKDTAKADALLTPLIKGQKFFRFPYLNEGKSETPRNQMRAWLKENQYRNAMVSVDNDDYIVSWAINKAKEQGKKIDYEKVERLFLDHVLGAADFYDDLAVKTQGYSPKHVLLLHEVDATVMFIESLVKGLRAKGWTIIPANTAYEDKLYSQAPENTYANNGIIPQVAMDKTGNKIYYDGFNKLRSDLIRILDIE